VKPGDPIELRVTPDPYVTYRYAGASGDFNPIHLDEDFATQVGLPGRILHGLWTMAQVARAVTEAAGGPDSLKQLKVEFRGMGRLEEEIVVAGQAAAGEAPGQLTATLEAVQAGKRIIRNGVATIDPGQP
jgi:acyl dehydratase